MRPSVGTGQRRDRTGRGQTTVDYAISVGVFLVAVLFIVGFLPGVTGPFTANQAQVSVADRIADQLSQGTLGDAAKPYLLDEACTVGFFEQMRSATPAPSRCNFDETATTLNEVTDLESTRGLNVTIEDADGDIVTVSGTALRAGDDPSGVSNVNIAKRGVHVDGRTHTLKVRVW